MSRPSSTVSVTGHSMSSVCTTSSRAPLLNKISSGPANPPSNKSMPAECDSGDNSVFWLCPHRHYGLSYFRKRRNYLDEDDAKRSMSRINSKVYSVPLAPCTELDCSAETTHRLDWIFSGVNEPELRIATEIKLANVVSFSASNGSPSQKAEAFLTGLQDDVKACDVPICSHINLSHTDVRRLLTLASLSPMVIDDSPKLFTYLQKRAERTRHNAKFRREREAWICRLCGQDAVATGPLTFEGTQEDAVNTSIEFKYKAGDGGPGLYVVSSLLLGGRDSGFGRWKQYAAPADEVEKRTAKWLAWQMRRVEISDKATKRTPDEGKPHSWATKASGLAKKRVSGLAKGS